MKFKVCRVKEVEKNFLGEDQWWYLSAKKVEGGKVMSVHLSPNVAPLYPSDDVSLMEGAIASEEDGWYHHREFDRSSIQIVEWEEVKPIITVLEEIKG